MERDENISYFAHEGEMARMERVNDRQFVIILVLIAVLVLTNAAWIWYESQWEVMETTQEVTQDTGNGGDNNFVGGDVYGTTESQNENP